MSPDPTGTTDRTGTTDAAGRTGKPRVLSFMQPTADSLHLGNYLGALRQWVALQDEYDAFYGVADLHGLTVEVDPAVLRERTLRSAAQMIAGGIDPERSTLFAQSHVPEHTQLAWILACQTGFGQARRMTQFKDKTAKGGEESASVGLFLYPVLMAADILIYQAERVPVGEDQRQHLELTRDLAQRFNHRFGDTFVVPEPHILRSVGKIQDLQDPSRKMSKSSSAPTGIVELLDEPKANAKKVRSAVTDSGTEIVFDAETKPGVANLLTILSALTGTSIADLVTEFEGRMYGHLKVAVADAVSAVGGPYRERTLELLGERTELEQFLAAGAEKARAVARETIAQVYDRVGLLP